jgi:glutamate-5-semialdehyde dehydrogenase
MKKGDLFMATLIEQGKAARLAAGQLMVCESKLKDEALMKIASALISNKQLILEANARDLSAARQSNMTDSLIDRLTLTSERIDDIAKGVREVVALADPIGRIDSLKKRPNGLMIGRQTVPLGVIAIIYESRPNVTVDAATLCLKSGNAVILRGWKEAFYSNNAFTEVMREAVCSVGLPKDAVSLVGDTSRDSVGGLMNLSEYVDVLIPRGGAGLINHVVANSKIPVIETGVGNCHVYVEASANLKMAADIAFNAKCRRVSVCNAAETLLVDDEIACIFLPMVKKLLDTKNTEIRGCEKTLAILGEGVKPADDED